MTLLEEWNALWPTRLNRTQLELWHTLQKLGVEAGWEKRTALKPRAVQTSGASEGCLLRFVVRYQGQLLTEGAGGPKHSMSVVRVALLRGAILLQQQGVEVVPMQRGP
jgi:hypothetical protein